MTYTDDQLRSALYQEHLFFAHDGATHMHPDDYMQQLATMSRDELVAETDTDDTYPLQLFMQDWLPA